MGIQTTGQLLGAYNSSRPRTPDWLEKTASANYATLTTTDGTGTMNYMSAPTGAQTFTASNLGL